MNSKEKGVLSYSSSVIYESSERSNSLDDATKRSLVRDYQNNIIPQRMVCKVLCQISFVCWYVAYRREIVMYVACPTCFPENWAILFLWLYLKIWTSLLRRLSPGLGSLLRSWGRMQNLLALSWLISLVSFFRKM